MHCGVPPMLTPRQVPPVGPSSRYPGWHENVYEQANPYEELIFTQPFASPPGAHEQSGPVSQLFESPASIYVQS